MTYSKITNKITLTAGTNLSFSGNTLNATSAVPTITASRVCVGDSNGNLIASNIKTTELVRLDGVSSNLQIQLNDKLGNSSKTINSRRAHGEVLVRCNTVSDSDTGGLEGGPRSQFTVNMRTRRLGGYNQTENKMRIECSHASDSNGRRDNMTFRGAFHSESTYRLSDDRAKFDEVALSNALDILNQLKIYRYTKYNSPIREDLARPTNEEGETEIGLIAQHVEAIPY